MSGNQVDLRTTSAASGYRSLGVLNSPLFSKTLINRFYCTTVSGQISSQAMVPSELKQSGDMVVFRRAPKPEIFDYVKNQDLEVSSLNTTPITMVVRRSKYFNLKLDDIDIKQIKDVMTFATEFQNNAVMELAQATDREMLAHIATEADCDNKGKAAGKISRAYNLGMGGAPVTITPMNLMFILSQIQGALSEQCADNGEMYVVLPFEAKTLFFNNPILTSAFVSGMQKSIVLGGSVPKDIFGLNIYFSKNLMRHQEGLNIAYSIPFGYKTATAFVAQMTKQQHITMDSRQFAEYWRGLTLYDFKVIRPELVGNLYATIQQSI